VNRHLEAALWCFAICVCIIAWSLTSGCAKPTTPTPVASPWRPAYDADYARVCACWGFTPVCRPYVVERTDCRPNSQGILYFETPHSPTGKASGIYYSLTNTVEWCDERAIIHELSHAVLYAKTGGVGTNGDGRCWL